MSKTFTIPGGNIHDLETLYKAFNKTFMENEDWELAQSLDALNDLFYGAFGMIPTGEPVSVIWQNFEQNKLLFGKDFTISWYEQKLDQSQHYNLKWVRERLAELFSGKGQTYFEIILEIIATHKNIRLIPA
ncbi:MAG: ribonuclease inhibitor [Sphingobacteriales bacterium]|nr:MAG: ribonuclease inhibitor [Sphingobacteriales bacterium]